MKNVITIISFLVLCSYPSYSQIGVSFDENGLMKNSNAFGALLCPLDSIKALEVLEFAKSLSIPEEHINGYCEVRAHFLCKKISSLIYGNGCDIGKIWAFSPSIYTLMWDAKLSTDNPLFEDEKINWDYHVAPVLSIQNGDKIDTVVIDFSFENTKFISYQEWLSRLNCPQAIYTIIDDDYFLFYTLEGLKLTGDRYQDYTTPSNLPKIITGHFYYLGITDKQSIPSGLAYNELAIHLVKKYYNNDEYLKYQKAIKNATKISEMKNLVSGQYTELPEGLVISCRDYFKERLEYWSDQIE